MAYSIQERYEEAQPHLLAACTPNPREENACYYRGRAGYALNRLDEWLTALRNALRTVSRSLQDAPPPFMDMAPRFK